MEKIIIKGESGYFLSILFEEVLDYPERTHFSGGFDVKANIEIKSPGITGNAHIFLTTCEIFKFYDEFTKTYHNFEGTSSFENYEHDLKFNITFDKTGKCEIKGELSVMSEGYSKLLFEFPSDQSYLLEMINSLNLIENKYGNKNCINNRTAQHITSG